METTGLVWGASHQTGWTGLVGTLITLFGQVNEKDWLESGIAFGVKQDKVLAVNNTVEESVAKATITADSER